MEPSESQPLRNRVFPALHEIAVALGGVLEPLELARLVVHHARELLVAGAVGLYVFDESSQMLRPLHSSDAQPAHPEPLIAPGEGAAGQAFVRGEPVLVDDYPNWEHAGRWAATNGVHAALAVPLQVAERRTGAMSVRTYVPRHWTADDAQTLTLLAAQVAPALEAARLYERTRDAHLQAEAAIKLRDEVLAGVSHDLAGPLARIRLYAELIQSEAEALDDSELALRMAGWSERIVAATASMTAFMQELIEVARLQMGRSVTLDYRQLDLIALTGRCIEEHQRAGRAVRLEATSVPIVGWWDEARLTRVVGNVLDNAIKYSALDQEVVVTLSREHTQGGWALLCVEDHGIGIAPEDMPRIFEPFVRGRNAADRAPGSGVGLAVARQIIEQHGGSLTVDSQLGVGTRLSVRLPCLGSGLDTSP